MNGNINSRRALRASSIYVTKRLLFCCLAARSEIWREYCADVSSQVDGGSMPECGLLFFVSGERIFRWWRSAVHLFRHRFLLRDWGVRRATFPGRFAFGSTCRRSRRSPLRTRPTFGTCPALGRGTSSLGRRAPFCSGAAFPGRPLFPGRARGRRTFLTLRHMLPPVRGTHSNKENLLRKEGINPAKGRRTHSPAHRSASTGLPRTTSRAMRHDPANVRWSR